MSLDTGQANDSGPGPPNPDPTNNNLNKSIPLINIYKNKLSLQQINKQVKKIIIDYYTNKNGLEEITNQIKTQIKKLFNNNNIQITDDNLKQLIIESKIYYLDLEQKTNLVDFDEYNSGKKTYMEIYDYIINNTHLTIEFINSLSDELILILILNRLDLSKILIESERIRKTILKYFNDAKYPDISMWTSDEMLDTLNDIYKINQYILYYLLR